MDWSEAERRGAPRPGDQAESEGSRAVRPAQRERDNAATRPRAQSECDNAAPQVIAPNPGAAALREKGVPWN